MQKTRILRKISFEMGVLEDWERLLAKAEIPLHSKFEMLSFSGWCELESESGREKKEMVSFNKKKV